MIDRWVLAAAILCAGATSAEAAAPFTCGGFALLGGAQLMCSHVDPTAATQFCTFSWALMTPTGQSIAEGSFILPPHVSNATVYQGSGFTGALSNPIVLCQSKHK